MPTKVTKFQSRNLFGESRAEQRDRVMRVKRELILSEKAPIGEPFNKNKIFFGGTTTGQKRYRRALIKKYS